MTEEEKQESQKTVVAFIAGLLIGGLLVWVFGGAPQSDTTAPDQNEAPASEESETGTESNIEDNTTQQESGDTANADNQQDETVPELPTGDASAEVSNQQAGARVILDGATFPSDEGWIGVRDYVDGQLTGLLGVVRYSKEQGLVPEEVVLQRATTPGGTYAIVFYSESGDRAFNLAEDVQVGGVMDTFTGQ